MHDLLGVHVLEGERHLAADATYAIELQSRASRVCQHLLERRAPHVLEDRVAQLDRRRGLPSERRRQLRRRVIEVAHDVRVRPGRLPEHAQHLGLAIEAGEGLGVHAVGAQNLDDDEEAVGLVPAGREDPALATLADALLHVVARPARPLQDAPGQQVAQRQQSGIAVLHGGRAMLAHTRARTEG